MSAFDNLSASDQARLEAAAEWSQRLRHQPDKEESSDFQVWAADPANFTALQAVMNTLNDLDSFAATPRILDMRQVALQRFRRAGTERWGYRKGFAWVAVVAVLFAISLTTYFYYKGHAPVLYATEIGERRIVALPDGSRISLDSNSEVRIRYTAALRAIVLERGRARFDVAHDVARPFTVTAGAETVVAVGTSFNVERLGQKVLITLIQGRVLIKGDDGKSVLRSAKQAIPLVAGEQMAAVSNAAPVVRAANLDAATAWEAGHLVFRGEPLSEAVERVNRYTDNPIVVDPSAASIAISGVFNAGDVGSFVSAITEYFPVSATTNSANRITLQRRS